MSRTPKPKVITTQSDVSKKSIAKCQKEDAFSLANFIYDLYIELKASDTMSVEKTGVNHD